MGLNAELIASKAKVNLLGYEGSLRNQGYYELGFWHRRHEIHDFLKTLYEYKYPKDFLSQKYKYYNEDLQDCLETFNNVYFMLEKEDLVLLYNKIKDGFIRNPYDDDEYIANEDLSFIQKSLEYIEEGYNIYYFPCF